MTRPVLDPGAPVITLIAMWLLPRLLGRMLQVTTACPPSTGTWCGPRGARNHSRPPAGAWPACIARNCCSEPRGGVVVPGAGVVPPPPCVGRAGSGYSLMDNTKREKMPTTCHRRMSQNTTVSLVSGGGLGLGGAVLGCGWERGSEPGRARAGTGLREAWSQQGLSPSTSGSPRINCLGHSQPLPKPVVLSLLRPMAHTLITKVPRQLRNMILLI